MHNRKWETRSEKWDVRNKKRDVGNEMWNMRSVRIEKFEKWIGMWEMGYAKY